MCKGADNIYAGADNIYAGAVNIYADADHVHAGPDMLGGVANPDGNKFCCSTSVQALPKLLPDFADWFVSKKVRVACPALAEYCSMYAAGR